MGEERHDEPSFICDAMLGGLARWLRAAGYDTAWEYGIEDARLIEQARQTGRILLSSDGPLFERSIIRDGLIRACFIPRNLDKFAQLQFVLSALKLKQRPTRCMGCGGKLTEIPRHEAAGEAPPLAFRLCDRFWRCQRCGKLFWHGTHWNKISCRLREIGLSPPEDSTKDQS